MKFATRFIATTLSAILGVAAIGVSVSLTGAQEPAARADRKQKQAVVAPKVEGAWTGDWGMYSPPPKNGELPEAVKKHMYPDACKVMDCAVVKLPDGKYQATFEGECGRPYKYTIKMIGREAGGVVMFQGSADLGEKDGGVFDWIGRANGSEFVGFFTSAGYTGTFRLARK